MTEAKLFCEDCGSTNDDVQKTICPYIKERHDAEEECVLCDDCYEERVRDT